MSMQKRNNKACNAEHVRGHSINATNRFAQYDFALRSIGTVTTKNVEKYSLEVFRSQR